MLKKSLGLIIFILFCAGINQKSLACQCSYLPFSTASDYADFIFKGVAINRQDSISIAKVFYTFKVEQVWKGMHYINVTIKTNYGGPACGAAFDINKEYVIYANNFETSRCTRNADAASVFSDEPRLNFKYVLSYKQQILNDTSIILSKPEARYFNSIFKNGMNIYVRNFEDINFSNKRIAFFKDSLISKEKYFELYGDKDPKIYFEKFSTEQISASGGYYGIVFINKKGILSKRQKKNLLHQLRQE